MKLHFNQSIDQNLCSIILCELKVRICFSCDSNNFQTLSSAFCCIDRSANTTTNLENSVVWHAKNDVAVKICVDLICPSPTERITCCRIIAIYFQYSPACVDKTFLEMTTNTFVFFACGKLVYRWISWYSRTF